ncbi:hypothetical protein IM40_08630 [Candidatus Paracaedimonas acanthamoebae]|nr:hypothetical protein IM40_08630 [Candidatus Paracaedimonas acanthamoebae]
MDKLRYFSLFFIILVTISLVAKDAKSSIFSHQVNSNKESNSLIYADEVIYEKELDLIVAKGNVEIVRNGRILLADVVTYNKKTDLLTASGNVKLQESKGEIIFLDYAELSSDFKDGFVKHVRMLFPDEARLVASCAKRAQGELMHFEGPVYSPCKLCKNDPSKPPLWQVKARHAEWDETKENIYYTDAFLEMFGWPAFYLPYFSHPAPNAKRRTGILSPTFSYISELGPSITTPVFIVLSKDKDLTLSPTFFTKNFFMLQAEYQQRFERGEFSISGSVTSGEEIKNQLLKNRPKTKESGKKRWHIFSTARYEFTKNIRGGLDIERASDSTYFKRYKNLGITRQNSLTSKAYVEGFWGRSYGQIQSVVFQGLRQGDQAATTPKLLPMVDYNFLSQPDNLGGRFSFDGNFLSLARKEGTNIQRLSGTGGWQIPYLSSWGEIYTIGAKLRGDTYHIQDFNYTSAPSLQQNGPLFKGTISRALPQAYANWRMPFIRPFAEYRLIAEPIIGFIASPNIRHPNKLPNEDSRFFELDDINLFNDNRMAGLDRIDGGTRLNYGFNIDVFAKMIGNSNLFIGQSFAFNRPHENLRGTGLHKGFSDYVARFKYNYKNWVNLNTRFLLNRNNLAPRRSEISVGVGKPILRLQTDFIQLPRFAEDPNDRAGKQIRFTLSSNFIENWSASISTTRQLGRLGGTLANVATLTYTDECFIFSHSLSKTFYIDKDVKPGTTYMFRIVFKNLGEVSQSFGNKTNPLTGEPII